MLHPTHETVVRPAVADDAPALAGLSAELGYPSSDQQTRHRLESLLASTSHSVLVACLPDGTVVGWIHAFAALRLESDPCVELGGFVVAEPHRRHGVGSRLLAAAEAWAMRTGATRLRVRTRSDRVGARAFYERTGFVETKRQRVLDKPLGPS